MDANHKVKSDFMAWAHAEGFDNTRLRHYFDDQEGYLIIESPLRAWMAGRENGMLAGHNDLAKRIDDEVKKTLSAYREMVLARIGLDDQHSLDLANGACTSLLIKIEYTAKAFGWPRALVQAVTELERLRARRKK